MSASHRIISLDQFRGYTVLGMFVVNFLGYFTVVPAWLKHHNTYCSYPDTIMPQFFFAVGFAYRLTFLRRAATLDRPGLWSRFLRRNLGLIGLGIILYVVWSGVEEWLSPHPPRLSDFLLRALKRELWQTLVHIAVTALWVMPVIGAGARARVAFMLFSAGLHLALSHWFYYQWVMTVPGIDGGPLGFLTWTIPMLTGSLAYDVVASKDTRGTLRWLSVWGLALLFIGYAFACVNLFTPPNVAAPSDLGSWLVEPPFCPPTRPVNLWTMSQRAGSVSYLTFGAGFSLLLYALFVWICDRRGWQLGLFRTFGSNALAGYVIHLILDAMIKPFTPTSSPLWMVLAALGLFLILCYLAVRVLEKKRIFLRL